MMTGGAGVSNVGTPKWVDWRIWGEYVKVAALAMTRHLSKYLLKGQSYRGNGDGDRD